MTVRWPRHVARLVTATVVLGGPPALLVSWVDWSSLHAPTGEQTRAWIADPLTPQTVAVGLLLLAAAVWCLAVAIAATTAWTRLRSGIRRLRRLPLPTPAQATATSMAGAAMFGVPTSDLPLDPPPSPEAPQAAALHDPGTSPTTTDNNTPRALNGPGVDLPDGGWVPQQTADDVAAAAGYVWLRRRRVYRPHPSKTGHNDDLQTLPPVAAYLQDIAHTHGSPHTTTGHRPGEPLTINHLPAAGVGLTGPGAEDAARGLLVTTLLPAPPHPPTVRIVTTQTTLEQLLGADTSATWGLAGLHVATSIDAALAYADNEDARRTQTSPSTPNGDEPPERPPLVLLLQAPSDAVSASRLTQTLARASYTAALLGAWPAGTTWYVNADGNARAPLAPLRTPSRMCVLGDCTAVDLLTVARHAYGTPSPTPPSHADRQDQRPPPPPMPLTAAPGAVKNSAAPPLLSLKLLGRPALAYYDEPVKLRRSAAMQILVHLAVHPHGATSAGLGQALWPGERPTTVTNRVYTTISELRHDLQRVTDHAVVHRNNDRYTLDAHHVDVDFWRLLDAVHNTASALTTAERKTAFHLVINLYTGQLADGQSHSWLNAPREQIRRHIVDAYVALADGEPPPQALTYLRNAIRVDPLNEELHRHAMRVLAATGDTAGAANLIDTFVRRLDEFNMKPEPDTPAIAAAYKRARSM